jgi:predicted MPP superfamily phosphohydrolase
VARRGIPEPYTACRGGRLPARTVLPRFAAGAFAAGAVAAAGVLHRARHTSPYAPCLERLDLAIPARFSGWQPFRIGFITDTHIGPVIRAADIDRALSILYSERPDLLLLGGDYICESPRFAPDAAAVLGDHATAVPFGALAVLGNHDYSCDAPRLTSLLERRGIRVLRNESARVATHSGELWVAGIDDAILGSPDVPRAFANMPSDGPVVAIWHEPDWASETAQFGPMLQLSGHSHGGQVRLPLVGHVAAPSGGRRYVAGMHHAAGMPVYTSRGVGVYRPPIRFRCPPEVTLITMQPSPGA